MVLVPQVTAGPPPRPLSDFAARGVHITGDFPADVDGQLVTVKAVMERTAVVYPPGDDHDTRLVRLDRILVDVAVITPRLRDFDQVAAAAARGRVTAMAARTAETPQDGEAAAPAAVGQRRRKTPFNAHRAPSIETTRQRLREVHDQHQQLLNVHQLTVEQLAAARARVDALQAELEEARFRNRWLEHAILETQEAAEQQVHRVREVADMYCELEQALRGLGDNVRAQLRPA